MFKKSANKTTVCVLIGLILLTSGTAQADWLETFDGNTFDLSTWLFSGYPDLTKTFKATIQDGPDDNDYITLDETSPADVGGSQFGIGIGDPDDKFTDVRIAATSATKSPSSRGGGRSTRSEWTRR